MKQKPASIVETLILLVPRVSIISNLSLCKPMARNVVYNLSVNGFLDEPRLQ